METKRVETLTPYEAGKMIGKGPEYIRALLRQGRVDWGMAAQNEKGQWNYSIIKSKYFEFIGEKASD